MTEDTSGVLRATEGATTAFIVRDRARTRRVEAIDLTCDGREMPTQLPRSYEHWIAGVAGFEGAAAFLESGAELKPGQTEAAGAAALAVGEGRLVAIVSPYNSDEPAVWLASPIAELKVATSGRIGLVKKRPEKIAIHGPGWTLRLAAVSQFYVSMNSHQTRQENSLLAAFGS
jgi:hypothetical protein